MTGDESVTGNDTGPCRRARIETTHADAETATILARALTPDNTPEMDTHVEGARIVTTIARGTTGGLHATVDDYVRNLQTAQHVTRDREPSTTPDTPDRATLHSDGPDREADDTTDTDT